MKRIWIFLLFAGLLLVACGGAEKPAASNDTADSSETGISSKGPEVDAFTLENLRFYHTRVYYLRAGENLMAVSTWIASNSSFPEKVVRARLVELNPGNIVHNDQNIPGFANASELAPVNIPDLSTLPSNMELGVTGPCEKTKSHTVVYGDTLSALALEYGFGTYTEFAEATRVDPDIFLQEGQVLTWTVEIPAHYTESENWID